MKVWLGTRTHGTLMDADVARIGVLDRGFTLGEGVFETVKLTPSGPFALSRHLHRLVASARILGVPAPDLTCVREGVDAVLSSELAGIAILGRLRITYSAGIASKPTLVVSAMPMAPWPESTTAVTAEWTRNPGSAIAGAKSTSYAENAVALRFAHDQGASEAILANTRGELCEGTASNIFVVLRGQLLTPPLSSGCLPGVTRELILEAIGGEEATLGMDALAQADEVFLTSSTRDVHPVTRLDDRHWEHVGPVTTSVRTAFTELQARHLDP